MASGPWVAVLTSREKTSNLSGAILILSLRSALLTTVRPAAVAGTFYSADPALLVRDIGAMLDQAVRSAGPVPKAIIVPHAGYIYSGPVAASAYVRLGAARERISRV